MSKEFSLIALIIVFSCSIVSAQSLFDDAERANADMSSYQYYNKDKDGFSYSGGVNWAPPYKPTEKIIELHTNVEAGCKRFDWEVNWQNTFSQEALDRYWENLQSGIISSAPLLLVEYISPTLADILKHFKAMTNMSMDMEYASCERMQSLATDLGSSLRNREYNACMQRQDPSDIAAARKECEQYLRGDWASGLNKYQGGKSLNEGEGYTLFGGSSSGDRKTVSGATKNFVSALFGELTLKADGSMHWTKSPDFNTIKKLYTEEKEKHKEKILEVAKNYEETGEYTEEDQKSLSSENSVVNKEAISALSGLSETDQQIVAYSYSSGRARSETIRGLNEETAEHRLAQLNPEMTAEEREMHQRIVEGLSIAKDIINEEFELGKEANAVMQATISRSRGQRTKGMLNLGVTATEDDIQAQFPGSPLLKE